MGFLVALLAASFFLIPAHASGGKPKFGPNAVPVLEQTAYLRKAPALDFWKLSPFYVSQQTSSSCSVASITMAMNFLRGLPAGAEEPIITQALLLKKIADPGWASDVAEGGSGVTFAEFVSVVNESLATFDLQGYLVDIVRPDDPAVLERLRQALKANEASDQDIILVYFDQGVLTGDWDGPHISPIAAYDPENGQVLIMDVDRQWYIPYWTSDTQLLEAIRRPTPTEHGRLAGERGGLVWIKPSR
jgi:hypothetical protein